MSAAAAPATVPDPTGRSNGGRPRSSLDWPPASPHARPAAIFGESPDGDFPATAPPLRSRDLWQSGGRLEARPAGQRRSTRRPQPDAAPAVTGARRSDTLSRGRPHLSEPAMAADGVLPELAEVDALIAQAEAELAVLGRHPE